MDPVQQPLEPVNPDGSENPEIPAAPEPQSTPEMDQTEDTVQPPRDVTVSIPAAETQTELSVQTDRPAATESPEETPEETTPGETTPANTITDPNVQTSLIENTLAPQEDEPAPWAGVEEDTSVPDEEELKKIESSDGDYSARECMSNAYGPCLLLKPLKLTPWFEQTHTGRNRSSTKSKIPNTVPPRKPV